MELFTAKSAVAGCTLRSLIFRDFKDFNMNGCKVGVGQLELVSLDLVADMKAALEAELAAVKSEEGRHSALLLLTDIMKEGSELLMVSDDPARHRRRFRQDLRRRLQPLARRRHEPQEAGCAGPRSRLPQVIAPSARLSGHAD